MERLTLLAFSDTRVTTTTTSKLFSQANCVMLDMKPNRKENQNKQKERKKKKKGKKRKEKRSE
jgi:hypothetical protein